MTNTKIIIQTEQSGKVEEIKEIKEEKETYICCGARVKPYESLTIGIASVLTFNMLIYLIVYYTENGVREVIAKCEADKSQYMTLCEKGQNQSYYFNEKEYIAKYITFATATTILYNKSYVGNFQEDQMKAFTFSNSSKIYFLKDTSYRNNGLNLREWLILTEENYECCFEKQTNICPSCSNLPAPVLMKPALILGFGISAAIFWFLAFLCLLVRLVKQY